MDNIRSLYFDYQATTPVADEVLREMQPYFRETFGNPHSAEHIFGWNSLAAIEKSAQQVAQFVGADSDEIIFTSGATESNNLALLGFARNTSIKTCSRKRVLLSAIEHKSILTIGQILSKRYGFVVESIPVDRNGSVIASEFKEQLGEDVLLVSIMAVNNEVGTIQDIVGLSRLARSYGAIFHCDAAQAPMALNISDFTENVDMLSLSGHKMYGPKGVGVLYICRDIQNQVEPLIYGGGQQGGLRSGTLPTPLCVGIGAAASFFSSNHADGLRTQLGAKRDIFIDRLLSLPLSIEVFGPQNVSRHPGNACIGFPGYNAQDILAGLQPLLAASTGSACTSGFPEPSHVLKAIGLSDKQSESVIRFSLGFETTEEEIEKAVRELGRVLNRLSLV